MLKDFYRYTVDMDMRDRTQSRLAGTGCNPSHYTIPPRINPVQCFYFRFKAFLE